MEPKFKFFVAENGLDQLTRKRVDDAGYDIRCAEHKVCVPARESAAVHTGLYVAIPHGYVGLVKSRSGMAFQSCIEAGAGVIDASYRGEVKVLLHNHGDVDIEVCHGDRIAQLVLVQCYTDQPKQVSSLEDLGTTDRGSQGFGSSGVK